MNGIVKINPVSVKSDLANGLHESIYQVTFRPDFPRECVMKSLFKVFETIYPSRKDYIIQIDNIEISEIMPLDYYVKANYRRITE